MFFLFFGISIIFFSLSSFSSIMSSISIFWLFFISWFSFSSILFFFNSLTLEAKSFFLLYYFSFLIKLSSFFRKIFFHYLDFNTSFHIIYIIIIFPFITYSIFWKGLAYINSGSGFIIILLLLLLIAISFKLKLFKWNDLSFVTFPFLRKLWRKTSSDFSFGQTWSATIDVPKFTLKSLRNLAL